MVEVPAEVPAEVLVVEAQIQIILLTTGLLDISLYPKVTWKFLYLKLEEDQVEEIKSLLASQWLLMLMVSNSKNTGKHLP